VAARRPTQITCHGDKRTDDYFWLQEKDAPEVLEYLRAERAYAEAVTAPLESLREGLYEEIVGRLKETDVTVPYRKGKWL
jgi:oligopeptidase B